jgi:MFS family permease
MPRDSFAGQRSARSTRAAIGLIALTFAGSTLLTPLYVLYQARFGFSAFVLTIVYAAYVIGNATALLFLGRLSDSIGRRPVALAAMALCAVAVLLFVAARGPAWLFAGRSVSGLAVGLGSGAGAAWLTDMYSDDRARATLLAAEANLAGVGAAPLVAGSLASLAPRPLVTPYLVYATILAFVTVAILRADETVRRTPVTAASLRPQLALPQGSARAFIAPAVTAFVVFGFVGFYAALLPSILRHSMHLTNPVVGGAVLTELFVVSMLTMPLTRRLASARSMLVGLAAIVPGLALLIAAQALHLLALLILATACGGLALGLGYRRSLDVVNAIAPADQRAGVVSAYFLACFAGNAIPVIGVGVATVRFGPVVARTLFAAVMLLFVLFGLSAALIYRPAGAQTKS